jgi:hypothetical protein
MQCFCSNSILLLSVQIIQCMFCPDPRNVFQVFRSCITKQSINIIQQTAPSFVLVEEREAYYDHRHRRDIRNQFLQWVKQTTRQQGPTKLQCSITHLPSTVLCKFPQLPFQGISLLANIQSQKLSRPLCSEVASEPVELRFTRLTRPNLMCSKLKNTE